MRTNSVPSTGSICQVAAIQSGSTIYYRPAATGTLTLISTGSDAQSGIASSNFGSLSSGTGWTYTSGSVAGNPIEVRSRLYQTLATGTTMFVTWINGTAGFKEDRRWQVSRGQTFNA